ncbi:hypothetical protein [uncultured Tateyamaria sp.]|uniref:hypothetical protein n=1 Tax=uncultured Tateyamaria sp. TaxID=455651 RepID=UPI002610D662|nr:hypothetical protein [uncultured Tateyamaria sp.]
MNNLAAAPKTRIRFEPFHISEEKRAQIDGKRWKTGTSSAQFLNDHIFSTEGDVDTVGSKLFFFHCREDARSADIWQHLKDRKDIKVVFLNRRNLLDRHFSDLRAQKSGIWHPKTGSDWSADYAEAVEIKVNIPRMMNQLNSLYATLHNVKRDFKDHDVLNVTYENLAPRSEIILSKVKAFLSIEDTGMQSPFRSGTLTSETLRILNKKEIVDRLRASVFSRYLDTSAVLREH